MSKKSNSEDAVRKVIDSKNILRVAAKAKISAQAQALLSVLIAESFPVQKRWVVSLGLELLADRLGGVERHTVRRWAQELERAQLITRKTGRNGRITRWSIRMNQRCAGAPLGEHQRTESGAPALHNPVRQCSPDSVRSTSTGLDADRSTGSIAVDPRQSSNRNDALPEFGPLLAHAARAGGARSIELVRQLAIRGDPDARALIEELAPSAVGSGV